MTQGSLRASVRRDDRFPRPLDAGATALDLVYQAADLFRGIQERAQVTEARAHALCEDASERVRQAEVRAEAAERAQHELLITADQRLQDASRALDQAQARIDAQQDQLTACEFRAQAAEADAREARQALALVEEAIRRRLLCAQTDVNGKLAVA
jgi:hypothetical protein